MKIQNSFDEKVITKSKVGWKKKFQTLSQKELQTKLKEIESRAQFDSTKSTKKLFGLDPLASSKYIIDRDLEAQRRAIHELLDNKE